MVDKDHLLENDTVVGRMIHNDLQVEISVRGEVIVLQYYNRKLSKGVSVSFSPSAAEEINDIVSKAVKLARGLV